MTITEGAKVVDGLWMRFAARLIIILFLPALAYTGNVILSDIRTGVGVANAGIHTLAISMARGQEQIEGLTGRVNRNLARLERLEEQRYTQSSVPGTGQ